MTPFQRSAVVVSLSAGLLAAGPLWAQDGASDLSWPNYGNFAFDGNVANPAGESRLQSILVEPNGNLLIGGGLETDSWWLGELTPNGLFVPSFGTADGSGRVTACQIGNCTSSRFLAAALAGNHYVVVGANRFLLTSASAQSIATSRIPPITVNDIGGVVFPSKVAVQADGRIVVAGPGFYSAQDVVDNVVRIGVARLTGTLAIDHTFHAVTDANGATFDGGNVLTLNAQDDREVVEWMNVMTDGRIMILMRTESSNSTGQSALRLTSDGAPDLTYVNDGYSPMPYQGTVVDAAGFVDSSGRVFAVGEEKYLGSVMFMSLNSDGFATQSATISGASLECSYIYPGAIVMDSAGRLLVGGGCVWSYNNTAYTILARLRMSASGYILDQTFGGAEIGTVLHKFDGDAVETQFGSLAIDSTGRPVVGGWSKHDANAPYQAGIERFSYGLTFSNGFEAAPRGCLPPDCN